MKTRTKVALGIASLTLVTVAVTQLPSPRLFREKDRIERVSQMPSANKMKNAAGQLPRGNWISKPKKAAQKDPAAQAQLDSLALSQSSNQWEKAYLFAIAVLSIVLAKIFFSRKREK